MRNEQKKLFSVCCQTLLACGERYKRDHKLKLTFREWNSLSLLEKIEGEHFNKVKIDKVIAKKMSVLALTMKETAGPPYELIKAAEIKELSAMFDKWFPKK